MWKPNFKTFFQFVHFFRSLPLSRLLLAVCCMLLATIYPGQNALQRLVLHPGAVLSYAYPSPSPVLYPLADATPAPPTSSTSILIQDVVSKTVLYSRQPDVPVFPASTTKIMTALVALDTWPDLETVLTVQNEDRAIGQTIELVQGEQL